jgi:hypothetical protein
MPERHGTRGRNKSRGEVLEVARKRTMAEIELDNFMEEVVYPAIGQHRYSKLVELVDKSGMVHYGRGYMQGGKDERYI